MDKARIRTVGVAGFIDGRPFTEGWWMEGGPGVTLTPVQTPDTPLMGGWTFRELFAIANGVSDDLPVLDFSFDLAVDDTITISS